jgi:23S rRNA pseudouridine1911/1915/1917 synthase
MTLDVPLHKSETHIVAVPEAASGQRTDSFLAAALPDLSRSRIKQLMGEGHVTVDGSAAGNPSAKVKAGQRFELVIPDSAEAEPVAQALDLVVVYEDEDVIVIDKPAGMVVHPAAGNPDGTLVNGLLAHCGDSLSGIGGVKRPGIVHRIDKDTSGLLVVAKNDLAHQSLSAQFAAHSVERAYEAIVWGTPNPPAGHINQPIGRSDRDRKKMAVRRSGGKEARTNYRTLQNFGLVAARIECRLETGRTHQIRVHMSHMGNPLVGDPVYSRSRRRGIDLPQGTTEFLRGFNRQALHAKLIGFEHPRDGRFLSFESSLPNDIKELISFLDII